MIIELLDSTQRKWSISEISRRLDLPKSTTHVLVVTLERKGYITRDHASHRYLLGLKLLSLGRSVLACMPLPAIALPHIVADEPIRKLGSSLAERRQGGAVGKENINAALIIVIQRSDSAGH